MDVSKYGGSNERNSKYKGLKNNGPSGMPTTKLLILVATCLLVNNLRNTEINVIKLQIVEVRVVSVQIAEAFT